MDAGQSTPKPAGSGRSRARLLRPGRVFDLPSGVWVVDEFQPVAAVLEPTSGEVRRVVSWAELPPAAAGHPWPPPIVLDDGTSLWTQQEESGPLVRVGIDGASVCVWTRGLRLAACGPGVAWCATRPPEQEIVNSPDARGQRMPGGDRLLRVDADGRCIPVLTHYPVRSLHATDDALLVEVDVGEGELHSLGGSTYEVVHPTRWMRLAWDADVPFLLSTQLHGLPEDVTVVRPDWAEPSGRTRTTDSGAALRATAARVDITAHCWPMLPRPLDAHSYEAQLVAANSSFNAYWRDGDDTRPLASGMSGTTTALVGEWPDRFLQWTFRLDGYPGLTLRRRVPLYDELGRIVEPEHADIHLMEDIDTGALPHANEAQGGVLDV